MASQLGQLQLDAAGAADLQDDGAAATGGRPGAHRRRPAGKLPSWIRRTMPGHLDRRAVQPVVLAADAERDRAADAGRDAGRDGLAIHDLGDGRRARAGLEQPLQDGRAVAGGAAGAGVGDVGQDVDAARRPAIASAIASATGVGWIVKSSRCSQQMAASSSA